MDSFTDEMDWTNDMIPSAVNSMNKAIAPRVLDAEFRLSQGFLIDAIDLTNSATISSLNVVDLTTDHADWSLVPVLHSADIMDLTERVAISPLDVVDLTVDNAAGSSVPVLHSADMIDSSKQMAILPLGVVDLTVEHAAESFVPGLNSIDKIHATKMVDITSESVDMHSANIMDLSERVAISPLDVVDLTVDNADYVPVLHSADIIDSSEQMAILPLGVDDLTVEHATESFVPGVNSIDTIHATKMVDITSESVDMPYTPLKLVSLSSVGVDDREEAINIDTKKPGVMLETSYPVKYLEEQPDVSEKSDWNDVFIDSTEEVERPSFFNVIDAKEEFVDFDTKNEISKTDSNVATENSTEDLLEDLYSKISTLENAEIDFDSEEADTNFVLISQYKTEVCQIYEKIKRNAGETVKMKRDPIRLNATPFTEFNKKLEKMVNDDGTFPIIFDVLECFELCNRNYNYQLTEQDCLVNVEKALIQVRRELRKRRKNDLDETFSYYTNDEVDPALNDVELRAKLEQNKNSKN